MYLVTHVGPSVRRFVGPGAGGRAPGYLGPLGHNNPCLSPRGPCVHRKEVGTRGRGHRGAGRRREGAAGDDDCGGTPVDRNRTLQEKHH